MATTKKKKTTQSPAQTTQQTSRKPSKKRSTPSPGRIIALVGLQGFLSQGLLERLLDNPEVERVLAIDYRILVDAPTDNPNLFHHKLDLTNPTADSELAELLREEKVDTLLHLAFLDYPVHDAAWAHELESIGTMHILNACAAVKLPKLIVRSTTAVYGPNATNPNLLSEEHPLSSSQENRFISDKVDAEKQILRFQEWNPETIVTVLRFCSILGPQTNDLLHRYLDRPAPVTLLGRDPLLQILHEEDALTALEKALFEDHPGVFNIVPDDVLPLSAILRFFRRFPLPLPLFFARPLLNFLWLSELDDFPPSFVDFLRYLCVASGEKAKETMGFIPRYSSREALQLYYQKQTGLTLRSA